MPFTENLQTKYRLVTERTAILFIGLYQELYD